MNISLGILERLREWHYARNPIDVAIVNIGADDTLTIAELMMLSNMSRPHMTRDDKILAIGVLIAQRTKIPLRSIVDLPLKDFYILADRVAEDVKNKLRQFNSTVKSLETLFTMDGTGSVQ